MLDNYSASSLGEVFDTIRKIRDSWNPGREEEELWFRGAPKDFSLLPSLYRPAEQKSSYDELTLFESFKALGAPLAPSSVLTQWDWYFLGRHHGLPTRLLDWTNSVFAALFFALEPHAKKKTRSEIDREASSPGPTSFTKDSPVLWVIEARTLNNWAVKRATVIAVNEALDSFLPQHVTVRSRSPKWNNQKPMAIYPHHTNARLIAQAGRFTIHGAKKTPLEEIASKNVAVRLAQIKMSDGAVARLWDELDTGGVTPATLLQDLDSLVRYLKYSYDNSK